MSNTTGIDVPIAYDIVTGQYTNPVPDKQTNVKYDQDKVRMDLLPLDSIREVAQVYTMGAKKYAADGWRGGMSWRRIFAAMLRHATAWSLGEDCDPESGLNHMAHVAWGCLTLLNYTRTHKELDDRIKL